ncbi:MAG TPA: L-seryl-tRNA(Sec) selenium transferase, partial [Stellaceae bacterium]|nr:L-seryl-tRNA(Sec) selenium transferase [Stellaceae bacterium]
MTVEDRRGRLGLPAVDRVLRSEAAVAMITRYGRPLVVEAVRSALAAQRRSGAPGSVDLILEESAASLARDMQPSQRRVFNLTGTVLHTNLGRAPLPEEAIAAAVEAMRDPTTLEYDIETGKRGERDDHVAGWLT